MEEGALDITQINASIAQLEMAIDVLELGVIKVPLAINSNNIIITPIDSIDAAHEKNSSGERRRRLLMLDP